MPTELQQLITGIEALIKVQSDNNRLQETNLELSAATKEESRVQTEALAQLLLDLKAITETGNGAVIEVLKTHAEALADIADLKLSMDALLSHETSKNDSKETDKITEALNTVNETLLNLLEESKKKEQFDYDIEITPELFRKLKGENGKTPKKGEDYFTEADKKEIVSRATDVALARLKKDLDALEIPKTDEIIAKLRALPQDKITLKDLDFELPPDLTEAVGRLQAQLNAFKNGTMGTGPIESLSNVDITGLQDGYALKYDLASKTWKPGPASGGSANWGGIGGDIADQADLQAALGAKSNVGHTHVVANITDFDAEVDASIDAKVSELVKGGVQFALYRSAGLQAGDGFRTVVPFAGTITGWVIATKDGSNADITLNVKKAAYADVPAFTAIDGTEPIKLTAQNKNIDTTLTDWTTDIDAGDHVEITVESVTGIIAGVYGIISIVKTT